MADAARRGPGRLGRARLPRGARARVGARGRRGRRLPQLVRLAHAPQPQPGRRPDLVPHRDGARRAATCSRGPRADARDATAGPTRARGITRRHGSGEPRSSSCRRSAASSRGSTTRPPRDDGGDGALRLASRRVASPERVLATVLFTDIVGSTELAAALGDRRGATCCNATTRSSAASSARFQGRELDTAGDGFFAAFDGPARAVRLRAAIRDACAARLEIRAGLHTGECESSTARSSGSPSRSARAIASLAGPGEVLVSSTVKDLVAGSGIGSRIAASTSSRASMSRGGYWP